MGLICKEFTLDIFISVLELLMISRISYMAEKVRKLK